VEDEKEDMNVYFIIEDNLKGCPHVKLEIMEQEINAVVGGSGAEVSFISKELFNDLVNICLKSLYLLVLNGILVSAWGRRTQKIKKVSTGEI
jgi:ABC-type dipeptide/oligopeptide/nickel transport system ATPase component